ncbi:MAG: acyl-CoA synthetase [Caulobacteraceae bacterium]|nr:acyl-CoA synthetase [Caulobacteraceae bacterium]
MAAGSCFSSSEVRTDGSPEKRVSQGSSSAVAQSAADLATDDLSAAPCRPVRFGDVGLVVEERPDGALILSAAAPLAPYDRNLLDVFWRRAEAHPDRTWVARRGGLDRDWIRLTWGQARADISATAAWLLDRNIPAGRSILVLSENSLAHATWLFGAMAAGVPICSVSVNYSLLSTDFERLRHVVDLVRPAVIFAEQGGAYARAVAAVAPADAVVVSAEPDAIPGAVDLAEVLARPDVEGIGARVRTLDLEAPARYLLTSGSTGRPKAVIHTQAMMTGNTASGFQAMGDAFAWGGEVLDWLPWSHIAGSSLLTNISWLGGTLHIDDGRPTADGFVETLRNLKEIPLRFYGTMPLGYAMLADALERDDELRRVFFSELRAMLFGGAGLPQPLHDRLQRLAIRTTGQRFVFVSGYGSTETGSAISYTWWNAAKVGIGLPVPGASLKLVPADGAYEVRVKAPSVTPGYFGDPERTAEVFDEDGFLRMEDMVDFHDRSNPLEGLYFAGRRAEQFKLSNGTFVAAGQLRDSLLKAGAGLFSDLVVCGEGRDQLAVLAWPHPEALRRLADGAGADGAGEVEDLIRNEAVRTAAAEALARHNRDHTGQSSRIARLLFLTDPPSSEAQEVSDKGSINRAAVLRRRTDRVAALYEASEEVIVAA